MKIVIDGFGGDNAPDEVLKGAALAVKELGIDNAITGDEKILMERMKALLQAALPFGRLNPYQISGAAVPPEMFMGRREELNSILNPNGTTSSTAAVSWVNPPCSTAPRIRSTTVPWGIGAWSSAC